MRSAVGQASNAENQASATGANYGAQAGAVNSQLFPFLTRELNNPQGFTQTQKNDMLTSAEGGAGGSTAGLTTEANLKSARERNSGGFSGALDEAARQKDKALAGTSEGISAENAQLQNRQQQAAASGLGNMYGEDTSAQLKAMGLMPEDINAESNANKTGWLQNMDQTIASILGNGGAGGTISALKAK